MKFLIRLLEPLHNLLVSYMGSAGLILYGGKNDAPPPPNYAPMQAASDYAADKGLELGNAQIAEGARQYNTNMAVAQPVVNAQLGIMNDTRSQAADYYAYGQRGRPVEAALTAESMQDTSARDTAARKQMTDLTDANAAADVTGRSRMQSLSDANAAADVAGRTGLQSLSDRNAAADVAGRAGLQSLSDRNAAADVAGRSRMQGLSDRNAAADVAGRAEMRGLSDTNIAQNASERALITGGDQGIYDARREDIEGSVGRATADARQGMTSQYNQLLRQGMRYGYSPQAMAQKYGAGATQAGLGVASAANQSRQGGIANARGQMAQGYDLRNQSYDQQRAALGQDYDLRNQTYGQENAALGRDYDLRNQT